MYSVLYNFLQPVYNHTIKPEKQPNNNKYFYTCLCLDSLVQNIV